MNVVTVTEPAPVAARRPIGLYAVIAYSVFVAVQLPLAQASTFPLGRFTLEGSAAHLAVVAWSLVWAVMILGLILLRSWGYRLGLTVFGLLILLVGSNTLTWLADNRAPAPIVLKVAIWPVLPWLLTDVLVMAYLFARRRIFVRPAAA